MTKYLQWRVRVKVTDTWTSTTDKFDFFQAVAAVNRYTMCMVSKTSKGPLKSVMHFNDDFVTWVRPWISD